MVEAGANQVPEDKLLEALDLAHREIVKLCEAQEELRAQAGKPKWLDQAVTERARRALRRRDRRAHRRARPARGGAIVEEIVAREGGAAVDGIDGGRTSSRELQTRMSLAMILEKQRSAAVEAPSASSSRTTCARSPRPSRTRRS